MLDELVICFDYGTVSKIHYVPVSSVLTERSIWNENGSAVSVVVDEKVCQILIRCHPKYHSLENKTSLKILLVDNHLSSIRGFCGFCSLKAESVL